MFIYLVLYFCSSFQNTEQNRKEEISVENDVNKEELFKYGIANSVYFVGEVLDIGYQIQIEFTWKPTSEENQDWKITLYAFSPMPT